MAIQNDPTTAAARSKLYLQRARNGRVFNRTFAFYPGAGTTPTSFTGNLVLGTASGGVGAALINGAGPPIVQAIPCDEPVILDVAIVVGVDNVFVTVKYSNVLSDDIYVLFSSGGQSFGPSDVTPSGPDEVTLTCPDNDLLPPGFYSLKIVRAADPTHCFSVRRGIFNVEGIPACVIAITGWSGDGISPNPFLAPGDLDQTVSVQGVGFLSGALTVTLFPFLGGPTDLSIDSVLVVDDNNLTIQFDTNLETGRYAVRIELTADPACFDEYGDGFTEDSIFVTLA